MLGFSRTDHCTDPAQSALTDELSAQLIDDRREALVQGSSWSRQVLDLGGAGITGTNQDKNSGRRLQCRVQQRRKGVVAEQRVGGEGVDAKPLDRTPRVGVSPTSAWA